MTVCLQLHMDPVPLLDQQFPGLMNTLPRNCVFSAGNDILEFQWEQDLTDEKNVLDYIESCLRASTWSINMWWFNKKIHCVRPINSISIAINNLPINTKFLSFIPIVSKKEFNKFDIKKAQIINQLPMELQNDAELIDINTGNLHNPKLITIKIESKSFPSWLIQFLLKKHFYAFYYNSNALVFVNDEKYNISCMEIAINGRIEDYKILLDRDLATPIEDYLALNSKRVVNKDFGTISDEGKAVFHLYKDLGFTSSNNVELFFMYYKIGTCSNLAQEEYTLTKYIEKMILEKNNIYIELTPLEIGLIEFTQNLYFLTKLIETNKIFTAKKDPYGFRRIIKNLIQSIQNHHIQLPDAKFGITLELLNKRIHNDGILYKNMSYTGKVLFNTENFINKYKRIKNLLKEDVNTHIELIDDELTLLNRINNMSEYDINILIDEVIKYINTSKIIPHIERKLLLQKFMEQLDDYLQIIY